MKSDIAIILGALCELLGYVLCYLFFLDAKLEKKSRKAGYFGAVLAAEIVQVCFLDNLFDGIFPVLAGMAYALLLEKGRRKQNLKAFIYIALIVSLVIEMPRSLIRIALAGNAELAYGELALDGIYYMFPLVMAGAVIFTKKSRWGNRKICFYRTQQVVILIALVSCNLLVGVAEVILISGHIKTKQAIILGIAVHVIVIIYLVSLVWQGQALWKNIALQKEQESYQRLVNAQHQYINQIMKKDEELREFRHNIRAHTIVMRELLHKGEYDKAVAYMEKAQEHTERNRIRYFTGTSTVDAVLDDLSIRMKESGIAFQIEGGVRLDREEKILDFCICLYNLILNAIEASEKTALQERKIELSLRQKNQSVCVQVRNNCVHGNAEKQMRLQTDKSDTLNHGIGSKSIQKIVEKYCGEVNYFRGEDYFIAEILI